MSKSVKILCYSSNISMKNNKKEHLGHDVTKGTLRRENQN